MATPLEIWLEKKNYLEQQLAITSDPSQMFTLRKQIQECEQEIVGFSNQPQNSTPNQNTVSTRQLLGMKLTGQEKEQLQKALLEVFTPQSLKQMLTFKLDKDLDAITTSNGFSNIVFDLITTASKEGWVDELIISAKEYHPGNESFNNVSAQLLMKLLSNNPLSVFTEHTNDSKSNPSQQTNLSQEDSSKATFNNSTTINLKIIFELLDKNIKVNEAAIKEIFQHKLNCEPTNFDLANNHLFIKINEPNIKVFLDHIKGISITNQLQTYNIKHIQEILNQKKECIYQHIPIVNFIEPTIRDISVAEMKEIAPTIEVLFLTVNDWEKRALLSEIKPLNGKNGLLRGKITQQVYRIGHFGNYNVAHIESTMGNQGRFGSTTTLSTATHELTNLKVVILIGIAFGLDKKKQRLGDILIADSIFPYEHQKLNVQSHISRGQEILCGDTLSRCFASFKEDWKVPLYQTRLVAVHQGKVLSGEKLVNDPYFLDALIKEFPTAIGGEMEGAGGYAAIRPPREIILVKGICDWADGDKNDEAQPFAAFTAISLAKHVLSKQNSLYPLINNEDPIEPPVLKSIGHQNAALPLHMAIVLIFGILALGCIFGGIYAVAVNSHSRTQLEVFGANLSTGHVGVAFIGIGLSIAFLTVKAVLQNQHALTTLAPDNPINDNSISSQTQQPRDSQAITTTTILTEQKKVKITPSAEKISTPKSKQIKIITFIIISLLIVLFFLHQPTPNKSPELIITTVQFTDNFMDKDIWKKKWELSGQCQWSINNGQMFVSGEGVGIVKNVHYSNYKVSFSLNFASLEGAAWVLNYENNTYYLFELVKGAESTYPNKLKGYACYNKTCSELEEAAAILQESILIEVNKWYYIEVEVKDDSIEHYITPAEGIGAGQRRRFALYQYQNVPSANKFNVGSVGFENKDKRQFYVAEFAITPFNQEPEDKEDKQDE